MNIILLGVNSIFLFLLALAFNKRSANVRILFWPALTVKVVAGIALGLIYTYFYIEADTFYFFNDGIILANQFRGNASIYFNFLWRGDASFTFWNQLTYHDYRSLFLVKFVSILNIITGNNYWFTSIYFSLISFASAWRLLQALIKYFPAHKLAFIISCLCIPTVVFWSSGVIKESMELASLFLITSVFLKFWMKDKINVIDVLLLFCSIWVLWQVKYYYAAILLPVLLTAMVVHKLYGVIKVKKPLVEIGLWFGVFVFPMLIVSFLKPNFHADNFLNVIVKNYYIYLQYSRPDAVIHYLNLQANVMSILLNSPWALFSCLFRPFLWEVGNVFQVIASIENTILFVFTLFAIPRLKAALTSEQRLLFLSMLVYIVLLGVFLALSAPNFGTLSRFRAGFIPFYVMIICIDNPIIKGLSNFLERTFPRLVR
ncbi:MAG TPA: hypothetical protein VL443_22050 [Cyclobacteriaceae bacterium]|nr:hypothetical protein [Cyclobacteriaceae bacterium]